MTNSQERSLKKIKKLIDEAMTSNQEIKTWEVRENEYFVAVYVVYGYKDDEGTLGFFLRDHAHLFIGKRGAITYPCEGKRGYTTRKFNGYSILQAVIDQR